jgi:large subunit ribosomal protein L15
MKLHELKTLKTRKTQRIGRSGKRGSYSGRGQKGQRSRSGHRIRPAERDIILKLPKLRGFRNKPKADVAEVFNLGELSKKLAVQAVAAGAAALVVNHELLRKAKLVNKDYKRPIKILGTGEIAFPIAVHGFEVSKSAKLKIEKAGGSVK